MSGSAPYQQLDGGTIELSTSGHFTASFAAANNSGVTTITLTGAATQCWGVASCGTVGITPCIVEVTPGATGVSFEAFTVNLAAVTGSTTVMYYIWGS